ncbi:MAG: acyltransferase, partial [Parvularculaceae bacterium]|nr:acyltransferase [Parvularculaceae bacterium]
MTGPRTIEDAWRAGKSAGNNFDAIRLFAAALVIFSHSYEVSGGGRATEPFEIISGQISFGELAVLIFFALSGFLIAKSWAAHPQLSVFMRNRVLRIMPALLVSVALLVFIAGPLLTT